MATQKPQDAINRFQDALRIKPNYAEAHLYWGTALALQEQFHDAAEQLKVALRLNPQLKLAEDYLHKVEALRQQNETSPR